MRARRGLAAVAALVVGSGALVGCGTTLIKDDVVRQGDGWTMVLQRLSDGPDQIGPVDNVVYHPDDGERFIHVYLKIRNDSPKARVFSYRSCVLDYSAESIVPGLITRYNGVMTEFGPQEAYDPGEVSHRVLTFSYPRGALPTRVQCASATFDVPQSKAH